MGCSTKGLFIFSIYCSFYLHIDLHTLYIICWGEGGANFIKHSHTNTHSEYKYSHTNSNKSKECAPYRVNKQMNERTNECTVQCTVYTHSPYSRMCTNIILLIDVFPSQSAVINLYSIEPIACRCSVCACLVSMPSHEFVFVILKYNFKVKIIAPAHQHTSTHIPTSNIYKLPCNGTAFVIFLQKKKSIIKYSFTSLQSPL